MATQDSVVRWRWYSCQYDPSVTPEEWERRMRAAEARHEEREKREDELKERFRRAAANTEFSPPDEEVEESGTVEC